MQYGLEDMTADRLSRCLPRGIIDVFALPSPRGRVYAIAESLERVRAVFKQSGSIVCVPPEESADLITYSDRRYENKSFKGPWARFRRGERKGNLAIVMEISEVDNSISVATVPRVPLESFATAGKRKQTTPVRAALFDPKAAEAVYGRGSVTYIKDRCRFKNQTYVNGLLLLNNQAAHLFTNEAHPALEELILFSEARLAAIESHVMGALKKESVMNVWQRGDRVKIISGPLISICGQLESLDFEQWLAAVHCHGTDIEPTIQDISLDCLQRYVEKGDSVRVVAGRNKERCGLVVSVMDTQVVFVEYKTREEVRVIELVI